MLASEQSPVELDDKEDTRGIVTLVVEETITRSVVLARRHV